MMQTAPASAPPAARQEAIRTLLKHTPFEGGELHLLPGDASFRRYIRIRKGTDSAMLMDAPPGKEDVRPYMAIARHLHEKGYSAPAILAQDVTAGLLLLEDLGDDSFTIVLKREGAKQAGLEQTLYAHAIDALAQWQRQGEAFANPHELPLPVYDSALLLQEVRLFADWYLPQALGKENAAAMRDEYLAIWQRILQAAPLEYGHWAHRDYHADNLMWLPSRTGVARVGLLDFQDAVYGDPAYDLVSLLEDARRDVAADLAAAMKERYLSTTGVNRERFLTAYAVLGAQRNSKIVGIFARLAARDNKYAYLQFLPRVWRHLESDLAHPLLRELKQWLEMHIPDECRGIIEVRHTSQELALTA